MATTTEAPVEQKCTHKGCERTFTDPNEICYYHPGAPIFHEGQKGWQCCKQRVLTFDEFLAIPPCTEGRHDTSAAVLAPVQTSGLNLGPNEVPVPSSSFGGVESYGLASKPLPKVSTAPPPKVEKVEKPLEQDPVGVTVQKGAKCKRLGCRAEFPGGERPQHEKCVFHPGVPIFHEGSKGYSCCKRRVLEFEEFLKIKGCAENRHLYVGEPKQGEELVTSCRSDFYQTWGNVIVSLFAKKVDKDTAVIKFAEKEIEVDVKMDGGKRFKQVYPLYGPIDPEKSTFKVMGTKVEMNLKKADTTSWPTLRSDEVTGEIIQIGKPATA
ncbi:HSP20-like chaperone [Sphaerosporella brunnea]|uniref:HSP20-like chaperone n=1 Tax=Sphaerosporella brunnea TaxID=1250544 RepID=A0A5J5EES1_9PEZI|nr:HSP20-like chaperone [Sphaerosporella brunnea]